MQIKAKNLEEYNFSDFDILYMNLFIDKKELIILIEGGYWNDKFLERVNLSFTNFKKIEIELYDDQEKKWISLNNEKIEMLKDICEIFVKNNICILRGFGQNTGKWIEYRIYDTIINVSYQK